MAVDDDFSFPTASDPFNRCGIDSPPLWRLSPAADLNRSSHTAADGEKIKIKFTAPAQRTRRRFSSEAVADVGDEEEAAAEKMDVLWENFNEELSRSRRSRLMKSPPESVEEIVKARRRAELNLSESSGAVAAATARKTGKTVIVKVLKKLFLLHNNSRRKLRTPPR